MKKELEILGVKIKTTSKNELIKLLEDSFSDGKKISIAKINAEFITRAKNNTEFCKTLNSFDVSIVDGVGVEWAEFFLSKPISNFKIFRIFQAVWQMVVTGMALMFSKKKRALDRIPGQEAFYLMLGMAEKNDAPVYILGGEQDVLDKAIIKITKDFPRLKIVGANEGWNFETGKVVTDINKSKAEFLVVAIGSPRQEFWIKDNIDNLKTVKVAVGEGGTLDFVAGTFKRAPKWMQRSGLEWFWRVFANRSKTQTGSRLKRVWNSVPLFIYEVVKYKIKNGQNGK